MKELILNIEGMHCNGCAMAVKGELEEVDNVKDVNVNKEKKQAVVKYEKDIDYTKIENLINSLGFSIVSVS